MDKEIQYKNAETKRDWFKDHVLSKEQYAQLIANKLQRVKVYQILYKVN